MHRQLRSCLLGAPSGAAALVLAAFAAGSTFAKEPPTVIRGATVYTGDEVLETATVTIVLTTSGRPAYLRRALDAGAAGYLLKDARRRTWRTRSGRCILAGAPSTRTSRPRRGPSPTP